MTRIQDVSNIYGGIAGSIPGAPTMPFQPSPMVTGIGGGLGAANIMGMFGQQNTQQGQQFTGPFGDRRNYPVWNASADQ